MGNTYKLACNVAQIGYSTVPTIAKDGTMHTLETLRQAASKGGQAKTPRKLAAARKNAAKARSKRTYRVLRVFHLPQKVRTVVYRWKSKRRKFIGASGTVVWLRRHAAAQMIKELRNEGKGKGYYNDQTSTP